MASKRPHKTLTLTEKHQILQQLRSGVSGRDLALKYGVGKSTISDIKRKSEEITSYVENCFSTPGHKKSLRKGGFPRMEAELYSWFLEQSEHHSTVTSKMLCEKAMEIHKKHYGDQKFIASQGWVCRFKKRHGICDSKITLSSDPNVKLFLEQLSDKAREMNMTRSQIYNADESLLFWKSLPDCMVMDSKEKTTHKHKTSKEKVTFLTCANGDGSHKLELMVVGESKMDALNNSTIPVEYHYNKNALMSATLFVKWFHESFVKQVKTFQETHHLNGKAILLIDKAPRHATETQLISDDGNIVAKFIPSDSTSLIQPMDQTAIRIKIYYRKSLLGYVSSFGGSNISESMENMSMKDALILLGDSWERVTSDAISKCWSQIFFSSDEDETDSGYSKDLVKLECTSEETMEIAEINMLQKIGTENSQLTESEICEWIVGDEDELLLDRDENESEEIVVTIEPKSQSSARIEHDEAIRCFNTCIQWAEENGAELSTVSVLQMLRQSAMQAEYGNIEQTNFLQN